MYASVKPLFTNILDTNQYTQEMEVLLLGMKMRMDSDYLQLKNGDMLQEVARTMSIVAVITLILSDGTALTAKIQLIRLHRKNLMVMDFTT